MEATERTNLFHETLAHMRQYGWAKGTWGGMNGPKCLYGALDWVQRGQRFHGRTHNEGEEFTEALRCLWTVINALYNRKPEHSWGVTEFNDYHAEDFEADIAPVLEKAAVAWGEREGLWDS